ncbi:MAG TPA: thioredoxin family protein [Bacteroidales bacterium]|nr:thioredoxin family protein [Bacteroidales bacterium]HQP04785.1 thioredoxin family protein [Bacteroidales bacterium]
MKKLAQIFFTGAFLIYFQIYTHAQDNTNPNTGVQWLSLEQAVKLQQAQPKTIMIDMYTDWCGWCKKMEQVTFSNPDIARYINQNFYPVRFNAETRDTVYYRDTMYVNTSQGQKPAHQLAIKLLGGRMSYPTIVYIDDQFHINAVPGYMDAQRIEPLLVYFAEKIYKTANYTDFEINFRKTFFPDTVETNINGKVEWISFADLKAKMQEKPKKVILFIYHDFTTGSRVMGNTTYTHPVIADLINENFYAVKLDVLSTEAFSFFGKEYKNDMVAEAYPHQLAVEYLQPVITLPATVFFEESGKPIYIMRGYVAPWSMEMFIDFIRQNLYRTSTWESFKAGYQGKIERQ